MKSSFAQLWAQAQLATITTAILTPQSENK